MLLNQTASDLQTHNSKGYNYMVSNSATEKLIMSFSHSVSVAIYLLKAIC